MEPIDHLFPWLELMDRPAFCVQDGVIVAANAAAEHHMFQVGTDVRQVVAEHWEAYDSFENGCLYLTVTADGLPHNASVTRTRESDVFILQQAPDSEQLQVLALAAQQLRIPLSNVMTVADRLLSGLDDTDARTREQAGQINHGLFQLLRIISNMSDTGSYRGSPSSGMQTVNITCLIDEIMEKIQTTAANTDITVSYESPNISVFGLANAEKLERAIYNLLSNALKFSPAGSVIDVKLTQKGNFLSFSVCNADPEPVDNQSFWNRYRREPAIEDSRYGLGLGMTLICSVAAAHKGTVLIDHPSNRETRVTMTIATVKDNTGAIRSPILPIGDYAGGRDKALLEFADILPTDIYDQIN